MPVDGQHLQSPDDLPPPTIFWQLPHDLLAHIARSLLLSGGVKSLVRLACSNIRLRSVFGSSKFLATLSDLPGIGSLEALELAKNVVSVAPMRVTVWRCFVHLPDQDCMVLADIAALMQRHPTAVALVEAHARTPPPETFPRGLSPALSPADLAFNESQHRASIVGNKLFKLFQKLQGFRDSDEASIRGFASRMHLRSWGNSCTKGGSWPADATDDMVEIFLSLDEGRSWHPQRPAYYDVEAGECYVKKQKKTLNLGHAPDPPTTYELTPTWFDVSGWLLQTRCNS